MVSSCLFNCLLISFLCLLFKSLLTESFHFSSGLVLYHIYYLISCVISTLVLSCLCSSFLFLSHLSFLSSFYWITFSCSTLFFLSFAVCFWVVSWIMLYFKKECSCSFHWCFFSASLMQQGILLILSVWVCSGMSMSLYMLSLTLMANFMQVNLNEHKVFRAEFTKYKHNLASFLQTNHGQV